MIVISNDELIIMSIMMATNIRYHVHCESHAPITIFCPIFLLNIALNVGSGKSYSMLGYGVNRGIVPITVQEIFDRIGKNVDPQKQYQVTFSMLEMFVKVLYYYGLK